MASTLEFKISSGLKDIIGKDLITDDFIAVFELVKNSYDAHARNVIITFKDDTIIIADDGKGMTLKDLKEKWLFVAYSAKKDGTEDANLEIDTSKRESYRDIIKARKHYAGAKGIGRFSSDRLGSKLRLTTKTVKTQQYEQLSIDWGAFNNQTQQFGSVAIGHVRGTDYRIPFPKDASHGTILEISNTNHWNREKLLNLKHSLEKLINPFNESNDFNVEIICSREEKEDIEGSYKKGSKRGQRYIDRDKVNGPIKNAILDILELKTTQISVSLLNGNIVTQLYDRGDLIYDIKEPSDEYRFLKDAQVELFFLNRSAKINFNKVMGVEPVNFGSIFLFKNGFRVQPFGAKGDDSWGIDYRAQQGYNRSLSTRDLFGRVELLTNNTQQFKEVSSRSGGLVQTPGYTELISFFNLAHKRLERYVVGVLWGEAFKRKKYFGNDEAAVLKAEQARKDLSADKDSDNFEFVKSNLGSKIDFIQLIKSLSSNKNITIRNFNQDLLDLVNSKLDDLQPKFISDLGKIAEQTNDDKLKAKVIKAETKFEQLLKEKEEAQRKLAEEEAKRKIAEEKQKAEEERRKKAEEKQKAEEERRKKAEEKQKAEEERRRKAELDTLRKEKERAEAELAKLKAEAKAKKEAELRAEKENELSLEKEQNKYLITTRASSEYAEDFNHIIHIISNDLSASLTSILSSGGKVSGDDLANLKVNVNKIVKLSSLLTKADLKYLGQKNPVNIIKYLKEYVTTIEDAKQGKLKFEIGCTIEKFVRKLSILDLTLVLDNLISNSLKAECNRIKLDIYKKEGKLIVDFSDNGKGLDSNLLSSPEYIFKQGITTTKDGSGIGLYTVKNRMEKSLHGKVSFIGNSVSLKGATFRLIFR